MVATNESEGGSIELLGAGRIGTALAQRAARAGAPVTLYTRKDAIDAGKTGTPIVVCTRADDLDAVLAAVPPARLADLVLTQNGLLSPYLQARELARLTRGLLFVAVPARGDDLQPGGVSPFFGPHAERVVAWLASLAVPAEVVTGPAFAALEVEKVVWNSAFGLLCQLLGSDCAAVLADARCDPLLRELVGVAAYDRGVVVDVAAMVARLRAYGAAVGDYRGAVKELRWRNGALLAASERSGGAHPTPLHRALLAQIGVDTSSL